MASDSDKQSTQAYEEDEALIEACIRGDSRAWERLVDRYGRLVYAIPSRLGLPPDGCEDVFQTVFAIVVRQLPRIRDRASLAKWLMTVAQRESYRWLRQQRRVAERLPAENLPEVVEEPPGEELERLERQHLVQEAVQKLGGRCRQLLTALFLDPSQPSYQEISDRLNIPLGSIGPTRNRCLSKLLDLVGDVLE